MKKTETMIALLYACLAIGLVYGECRCIYKMFKCNWKPIGKAEIIYTGSALTGLGGITGYFNIVDK